MYPPTFTAVSWQLEGSNALPPKVPPHTSRHHHHHSHHNHHHHQGHGSAVGNKRPTDHVKTICRRKEIVDDYRRGCGPLLPTSCMHDSPPPHLYIFRAA